MNSTLAIKIQFTVYNPNLALLAEKRIIIEFLETGGFINLEHDSVLLNSKLTRTTFNQIQSYILLILGIVLTATGIYSINEEAENERMIKELQAAAADAEEEGEGAPAEGEAAGEDGEKKDQQQDKKKGKKVDD